MLLGIDNCIKLLSCPSIEEDLFVIFHFFNAFQDIHPSLVQLLLGWDTCTHFWPTPTSQALFYCGDINKSVMQVLQHIWAHFCEKHSVGVYRVPGQEGSTWPGYMAGDVLQELCSGRLWAGCGRSDAGGEASLTMGFLAPWAHGSEGALGMVHDELQAGRLNEREVCGGNETDDLENDVGRGIEACHLQRLKGVPW